MANPYNRPRSYEIAPEFDEMESFNWGGEIWEAETNRHSREFIRWVQGALNKSLGLKLAVDGQMGPSTRSAIRSFQSKNGLVVDGIVGAKTEAVLRAKADGLSPRPAPPTTNAPTPPPISSSSVERMCPEPARLAQDRCLRPGTQHCPAIPNLLCVKGIDGISFEYPNWKNIKPDPKTGLLVVRDRQTNRQQRFTPPVRDALRAFLGHMRQFGMPVEAIITGGSLYCRCITKTDKLSNHSFGDAIDIVGLRWSAIGGPVSRIPETIVHNYRDPGQRTLLRWIDACLRLSFATVIDYHHRGHHDHFHCDMNRGKGRPLRGSTTVAFVQESLGVVLGRSLPSNGKLGRETLQALSEFSGRSVAELGNSAVLSRVYDELFNRVARG